MVAMAVAVASTVEIFSVVVAVVEGVVLVVVAAVVVE